MSQHSEPGRSPAPKPERGITDLIRRRAEQRRSRLRAEIQRGRTDDHTVPTWALYAVLVLIVAVMAYLIVTIGSR